MQWTRTGGFTRDGVEPWLPIGDPAVRNVADQRDDPGSFLRLCRDLIALRRERPDLHAGSYTPLPTPEGVWGWRRGERTAVSVNLSGRVADVEHGGRTTVLLGTVRDREGQPANGSLRLEPWEAVVLGSED